MLSRLTLVVWTESIFLLLDNLSHNSVSFLHSREFWSLYGCVRLRKQPYKNEHFVCLREFVSTGASWGLFICHIESDANVNTGCRLDPPTLCLGPHTITTLRWISGGGWNPEHTRWAVQTRGNASLSDLHKPLTLIYPEWNTKQYIFLHIFGLHGKCKPCLQKLTETLILITNQCTIIPEYCASRINSGLKQRSVRLLSGNRRMTAAAGMKRLYLSHLMDCWQAASCYGENCRLNVKNRL